MMERLADERCRVVLWLRADMGNNGGLPELEDGKEKGKVEWKEKGFLF